MEKADLVKKISEILGVGKPKDELSFEIFLEQLSEKLSFNEALRIPGVGIFQLREEPFTGVKKTLSSSDAGNKAEILFAPFLKDSDSLYLTFNAKKQKKTTNEYSDDIFNISVNKPIVPVSGNKNQLLDADTNYIILKNTLADLINELIDKSDLLENFDLWDDFINSNRAEEFEVLEEIVLEQKYQEPEREKDISDEEIVDNVLKEDGVIEDPSLNEESNSGVQEDSVEQEIPEIETTSEEEDILDDLMEDLDKNLDEDESLSDENLSEIDIDALDDLDFDDLLGDEEPDLDQDYSDQEENEIPEENLSDENEIQNDEIESLIDAENIIEKPETSDEKLEDDDFNLSDEELNDILENEENLDDDWDWGDELKQEIVDQDEDDTVDSEADDTIADDSEDLFDQLEETLLDENEEEDEDANSQLLNLEEELAGDEPEEIPQEQEEAPEENPETEEEISEEDKLDSLLEKKETKQSFMAKIKQKLGIYFWVLIGVFVITSLGGVYYFFFMTPSEIDLHDPLLDQYGVADTIHNETAIADSLADSLITATGHSVSNETSKEDHSNTNKVKDSHANTKDESHGVSKTEEKKPEAVKTENKNDQHKNKPEQKKVQHNTTNTRKPVTGKIKVLDNPKERKIGKSHIYIIDGKYSVQVSSWRRKSQADKEANRLMQQGHNVFIVKAYLRSLGSTWYRVRVGEFNTLEEAKEFEKTK